jgi:hypothetical protein
MSRSWPWPCAFAKGARAARVALIVRLLALVACARAGAKPPRLPRKRPRASPPRARPSGLRLGPAAQPKVAPVAHPHIAAAQHARTSHTASHPEGAQAACQHTPSVICVGLRHMRLSWPCFWPRNKPDLTCTHGV